MRTLLTGGVVVTVDHRQTVLAPGDVVLEEDRIAFVGERYAGPYDERLSLSGRLLMPGLVNAHTHSPMSVFRGLSDDVTLQTFLFERVWPREVKMTPEDIYAGSLLSAVEMLKCGVTTYVDMYFWEEELVRAALDAGIRAMVTPGILAVPAWEPLLGTWEHRTAAVVDFCRTWQGHDGRIHTGLGPHAPYTLPLEALPEIAGAARGIDVPVHIHLVETKTERDQFTEQFGASTAAKLAEIGFFEAEILAAHSVWIDPGDAEVYACHDVGVAHCPGSNAKLGAGIAPLVALLAAGVEVGLGTDGAATNNNHDLWDEVLLAPLLAKATSLDPEAVPAAQVLHMATRGGALAARLPEVGTLAPGMKADLISLRLDVPEAIPVFGPDTYPGLIVYSLGSRLVDRVWVNGQQVVRDGQVLTVDEEACRRAAQETALALAQRAET